MRQATNRALPLLPFDVQAISTAAMVLTNRADWAERNALEDWADELRAQAGRLQSLLGPQRPGG